MGLRFKRAGCLKEVSTVCERLEVANLSLDSSVFVGEGNPVISFCLRDNYKSAVGWDPVLSFCLRARKLSWDVPLRETSTLHLGELTT